MSLFEFCRFSSCLTGIASVVHIGESLSVSRFTLVNPVSVAVLLNKPVGLDFPHCFVLIQSALEKRFCCCKRLWARLKVRMRAMLEITRAFDKSYSWSE